MDDTAGARHLRPLAAIPIIGPLKRGNSRPPKSQRVPCTPLANGPHARSHPQPRIVADRQVVVPGVGVELRDVGNCRRILPARGRDWIAKVGDATISAQEFAEAYDRTLSSFSASLGQPIDREQARALGLPARRWIS